MLFLALEKKFRFENNQKITILFFLPEDEMQKERVTAKNALEGYCYSMKQTIEDPKLAGKISGEDKAVVLGACADCLKWLDSNQTAEKQEYEHKLKETEQVCNPVVMKLYKGEQEAGPQSAGGHANEGPKIEEVD